MTAIHANSHGANGQHPFALATLSLSKIPTALSQ